MDRRKPGRRAINSSTWSSSKPLKNPQGSSTDEGDRHRLPQLRPPATIFDSSYSVRWLEQSVHIRWSSAPPPRSFLLRRHCPDLANSNQAITLKPSPLALPPVLTSSISGDETTTVGCARMLRIFLFLAASSKEPPLAVGIAAKLAGRRALPPLLLFSLKCI